MKVLLTGGAGFIGSNIAAYLVELGHQVTVLDNLSTGFLDNIANLIDNPSFTFVKGDITDLDTCIRVSSGHDVICHQAALGSVPRSVNQPLNSHNSNVNGFINILEAARTNNIKKVVYASSSSVYGNNTDPIKTEDNIGKEMSPYAVTKHVDELYAGIYHRVYGIDTIGFRYFNVFGPKQNPIGEYAAVIPKFILGIINKESSAIDVYGDGSYSRDFTFISNVVQANYLALLNDNPEAYGQVYNVGTNNNYTINELIDKLVDIIKIKPAVTYLPNRVGDVPYSRASIDKIVRDLKYNVTYDFDSGLVMTVEYYLDKYDQ
ncbi:NAD-dependent epimerase/dehydratase [uncultured virus]|nr:NAD-dependent epimerase/dehydratase [uncultured virus]